MSVKRNRLFCQLLSSLVTMTLVYERHDKEEDQRLSKPAKL